MTNDVLFFRSQLFRHLNALVLVNKRRFIFIDSPLELSTIFFRCLSVNLFVIYNGSRGIIGRLDCNLVFLDKLTILTFMI